MRLLVLPGDGIGPEVTSAATQAVEALIPSTELVHGTIGRQALQAHGTPLPPTLPAILEEDEVDGILFGATETRPGEASAVLALRAVTGARCSIRPASLPQREGPPADVTVYRELTEDLYVQRERTAPGGAVAERPISRAAVTRFAELALGHAPTDVPMTVAHKATVLPQTDGLFLSTIQATARNNGRAVQDRLVDALAHDLALGTTGPCAILAPNLYGDLLSDLTAGLGGGLGLAPSLTLGDGPPIAEPVHGTAPDIAGQAVANPTAALRSLVLLLGHLGYRAEATALEASLEAALADPTAATPDLGGQGTTTRFTDAVLERLEVVA